jgi:hypothetical protein
VVPVEVVIIIPVKDGMMAISQHNLHNPSEMHRFVTRTRHGVEGEVGN